MRGVFQHHLNGLTVYARLRTLCIPKGMARAIARLWDAMVHPLLYPGGDPMKIPRIPTVRMGACLLFAALALAVVAAIRPSEIGVIVYKLALVSLAAVGGYWLDRALFPYSRPDGYLSESWKGRKKALKDSTVTGEADYPLVNGYHLVFCAVLLRRAYVIGTAMLAVGMGL